VSTIADPFRRFVDDAAVFPPGNAPLAEALAAHVARRTTAWADLVGPFVVSDIALPDLVGAVRSRAGAAPLPVSVVVTGGAGAVEPAVRWAAGAEELELAALELRLRDESDLPRNARRVTTVVDQLRASGQLGEEIPVYVEPPRPPGPEPTGPWLAALDEVAALDLRLKLRTGGTTADAFPSPAELAACIDAALDRELGFKCTAGLHNAVRHPVEQGFEHPVDQHGFLNVLLATRAALDGCGRDEVSAVLENRDPGAAAEAVTAVGEAGLVSARRWFVSFGSCRVREALDDLVGLGLVDAVVLEEPS
jgi:hypothetical protein